MHAVAQRLSHACILFHFIDNLLNMISDGHESAQESYRSKTLVVPCCATFGSARASFQEKDKCHLPRVPSFELESSLPLS